MKTQTAVEWFYKKLKNYKSLNLTDKLIQDLYKEAIQMEKEQIMKAVYDSMGTNFDPNMGRAEQYFNEMYVSTTQPRMNEDYSFEDGV